MLVRRSRHRCQKKAASFYRGSIFLFSLKAMKAGKLPWKPPAISCIPASGRCPHKMAFWEENKGPVDEFNEWMIQLRHGQRTLIFIQQKNRGNLAVR